MSDLALPVAALVVATGSLIYNTINYRRVSALAEEVTARARGLSAPAPVDSLAPGHRVWTQPTRPPIGGEDGMQEGDIWIDTSGRTFRLMRFSWWVRRWIRRMAR